MYVLIIGRIYYIYFLKNYKTGAPFIWHSRVNKAIIHSDGLILHIINFQSALQAGINQPVFVLLEYSISRNRLLCLSYACCNGEYEMWERIILFLILKSILVQVLILTIFFRKIQFRCIPYLTYGTSKSLDHEIHLKEALKKYLQKILPHHTFSKYLTFLPKY